MKKACPFLIITLFFSILSPANASPSNSKKPVTLYVTTGFTPPISDFYALVLHELGKNLPNIQFKFERLTAERSLDLVNRGVNDAECCRLPGVVMKTYKNIVPVTESFYTAKFTAFSKKSTLNIQRFEDLKPYSTATVLGWKVLVNNLNRVNPKEKYLLSTPKQMMEMLKKNRIEVALLGYESGLGAIHNAGLENIYTYLHPPLAEKPTFLMLHKTHANLVPAISKVIRKLKQNGTIQRLYQKVFIWKTNTPGQLE